VGIVYLLKIIVGCRDLHTHYLFL